MFKDYGFTLQEKKALTRKGREMDTTPYFVFIAVILLTACLIHRYIEPSMGRLITPEAHAAELHDLDAICAYAGLYPEKITNLKDLQIECANNGTPVQML